MKEKSMKALVYDSVKHVAVQRLPLPVPEKHEVLIQVAYSGICGTDLNIFQGMHPRARAPLVMGHELSGTVVQGNGHVAEGSKVTVRPLISCGECEPCKSGYPYVCSALKLYGIDTAGSFAEYLKVDASKVHVLPDSVDMKRAAFLEPLAVGVHAVKMAKVKKGSNTVVFGAGTIGFATAIALKMAGAGSVSMVELNPYRVQLAKELGFTVIDNPAECTNAFDYSFDCAGHPAVGEILTKVTAVKGTIVTVAAYKKPAPLHFLDMMFKELHLMGVRVYEPEDFDKAIALLDNEFPIEKLLTHTLQPEDGQQAFEMLLNGGDAVKVLFDFT